MKPNSFCFMCCILLAKFSLSWSEECEKKIYDPQCFGIESIETTRRFSGKTACTQSFPTRVKEESETTPDTPPCNFSLRLSMSCQAFNLSPMCARMLSIRGFLPQTQAPGFGIIIPRTRRFLEPTSITISAIHSDIGKKRIIKSEPDLNF